MARSRRRKRAADYDSQKQQDMAKGSSVEAGRKREHLESQWRAIDIESTNGELVNGTGGHPQSDWRKDLSSIVLLLILYTLQGIPMGLSGSIPFLLINKVSYSEQAVFSLVSLPFSLKLFWAPLVDSLYVSSFGRRKSWLVPAQLLCGGMMIWARGVMDEWIGEDGGAPHVKTLTAYFLALYFIMATQDIAVDGWALTMLSRENVGFASTCNTVGQTVGFFISQVGFLALYDAEVCNGYFRSEPSDVGMVTLSTFLQFWGVIFLGTTFFVCFFKTEAEDGEHDKVLGLVDTYKELLKCGRLPSVQSLAAVLLTCRIAFAVTDAATSLKLVEYGMPKEEIAMLSPILVTLGTLIPIAIGRFTAGPRPMSVFLWGYPLRICVTVMYVWVLRLARIEHMVPGGSGAKFMTWIITAVTLHEVASNCMFVAQMAFFSRVSDPSIGGSYMTLLNTIANLGGKWTSSVSLFMLDRVTFKHCVTDAGDAVNSVSCGTQEGKELCVKAGASCIVWLEGYTVQAAVGTVIGIGWLYVFAPRVRRMQSLPAQAWLVSTGGEKLS